MLDISRDKVPTMETLFDLVDLLAGWKINQFQLYTEHTFAYRRSPRPCGRTRRPITGEEILAAGRLLPRALHRAGAQPEQLRPHASAGSSTTRYLPTGRGAGRVRRCRGDHVRSPFTLDPGSIRQSMPFLAGCTTSCCRTSPAGCSTSAATRPWTWARAAARPRASSSGAGRVYLDFLLKMLRARRGSAAARCSSGATSSSQHPDLVAGAAEGRHRAGMGLRSRPPLRRHGALFAGVGHAVLRLPRHVQLEHASPGAPTTRSATCATRRRTASSTARSAVLNTDWGDNGHWQPLPVSDLGLCLRRGAVVGR